jgi:SAM-dependent methyltransferase
MQDLTKLDTHFAFGKNWSSFARSVGEEQISDAVAGVQKLVGGLSGARFLDIGCGSGLHSLAALRLGASEVVALDIDPDSVATARKVLSSYAPDARVRVEQESVFDLTPARLGTFDIVYSWGVLHHTGDLMRAIRNAASLVGDKGRFVFALYRRTWTCSLWRLEKRWYSAASPKTQKVAQAMYIAMLRLAQSTVGPGLKTDKPAGEYRGMDLLHDVHDWLGGYPYESIKPESVDRLMAELGLVRERCFIRDGWRARSGFLGSGCDEYVYVRP